MSHFLTDAMLRSNLSHVFTTEPTLKLLFISSDYPEVKRACTLHFRNSFIFIGSIQNQACEMHSTSVLTPISLNWDHCADFSQEFVLLLIELK